MTGALVVGILAGLGLVALLSALVPARTPVGVVLDRLHRQPPPAPPRPLPEGAGSAARLAQRLTRSVEESGAAAALSRSIEKDLLISSAFADASPPEDRARFVGVGRYALRGVQRAQELFTLDRA